MKDYWLVIDPMNLSIEICFPEWKMGAINSCLATIHGSQQEEMLRRLREVKSDTPPFTLSYEYFTMEVHPHAILCEFHMFEEPVKFFLWTKVFVEALGEYREELKKLIASIR